MAKKLNLILISFYSLIIFALFLTQSYAYSYTPALTINDNVSNSINSNNPVFTAYTLQIGSGKLISKNIYYQSQLPITISTSNNLIVNFTAACSFSTGNTTHYYKQQIFSPSTIPCNKNYTEFAGSFSIQYTNGSQTPVKIFYNPSASQTFYPENITQSVQTTSTVSTTNATDAAIGNQTGSSFNVSNLLNNAVVNQSQQDINQAYQNIIGQVETAATSTATQAVSSTTGLSPEISLQPINIILPPQTIVVPLNNGAQLIVTLPPITEQMNLTGALQSAFQNSMNASINAAIAAAQAKLETSISTTIQNALQASLGNLQTSSGLTTAITGTLSSSLYNTLENSAYTAISGNIGQTITAQTIPSLENSINTGLTYSLQNNLDNYIYSGITSAEPNLGSGLAQTLSSSIATSVASSTESQLNSIIYGVLNQNINTGISTNILNQISSAISTSVVSTTSGYIGSYISTNEQSIVSQLPTLLQNQNFGNILSSSISTSLASPLNAAFQNVFNTQFESLLQGNIQNGLSSLPSTLPGQLTSSTISSLSQSLSSQLSQSMSGEITSYLSSSMSQGFAQDVASGISQSLVNTLSASISQQLSQNFANTFSQSFAESFSSSVSQSLSSSIQQNLENTIPQQLSGAFGSSLINELSPSIGTAAAQQFASSIQSGLSTSLYTAISQGISQNFEQNIQNSLYSNLEYNVGQQLQGDIYNNINGYLVSNLPNSLSSVLSGSIYPSLNGNLQTYITQDMPISIQSSLQNSLYSGLQTQLQGVSGTLTSSLSTAISQSIATSVSLSLQQGLSQGLSSSLGTAFGQSLGSNLYNSFSTTLPSAISTSLSSSISTYLGPVISSNLGPSIGSTIGSSISSSLQSSIYAGFQNGLTSTLPSAVSSAFGSTISSSILSSLSNYISSSISQSLLSQLPQSVSSIIGQTLSQNVNTFVTSVGTSIGSGVYSSATLTSIGNGMYSSISQTLPTAISGSISSELSNYLPNYVSTGISNAVSGSISSALGSSLSTSLGSTWSGPSSAITDALNGAINSSISGYLGKAAAPAITQAFNGDFSQALSTYLTGELSGGLSSILGSEGAQIVQNAYNIYNAYESYSSSYQGSSESTTGSLLTTNWLSVAEVLMTGNLPLIVPVTTQYSGSNNDKLSTTNSLAQASSPASTINIANQNNAKSFLVCPTILTNGVTTSAEFTTPGSNVGGNQCINSLSSLTTDIFLNTSIHDRFYVPYSTVDNLQIANPGYTIPELFSYTPEIDNELSNGFSTKSYIFQNVPSSAQYALWAWSTPYVNFANAKTPQSASYENKFQYLILGVCNYKFTYQVTTTLSSITNINVPFEYLGPNGAVYNIGTPILPELSYNFNITLRNQNGYAEPNLTGLTFSTISPYHYYNPQNTLEPFPINLGSVFLAGFNSLGSAPYSGAVINRSGEGINTNVNNLLSSTSQSPSNTFLSANDQPISIAALPNDYIYVLYLNKSTAGTITQTSQAGNYNNNYLLNASNASSSTTLSLSSISSVSNKTYLNPQTEKSSSASESFSGSSNPTISVVSYDPTTHVVDLTGSGFLSNPSTLTFAVYSYTPGTSTSSTTSQTKQQYGNLNLQNIGSNGDFTSQITLSSSLTNFPYAIQIEETETIASTSPSQPSYSSAQYSNMVIVATSPSIAATYTSGASTIAVSGVGFTSGESVTVQYSITNSNGAPIPNIPFYYGTQTVTADQNGDISATLPVYSLATSYVAHVTAAQASSTQQTTSYSANPITISAQTSTSTPTITLVSFNPSTDVATISGTGFVPVSSPTTFSNFEIDLYQDNGALPPSSQTATLNPVYSTSPSFSIISATGTFTTQITLPSSLNNYPYALVVSEQQPTDQYGTAPPLLISNYAIISTQPVLTAVYNGGPDTISVQGTGYTPNNAVTINYAIAAPSNGGGMILGAPSVYGTTIVTADQNGDISATLPVYKSTYTYVAVVVALDSFTKIYSNKIPLTITATNTKEQSLGTYEIAVFRIYNNTYFNASAQLPGSPESTSAWNGYWNSIITNDNNMVHQVGNIPLGFNYVPNPPSNFRAYNLYNISLDYQGNIYISSSETYDGGSNSLIMKYVNKNILSANANTLNNLYCVSISCFVPSFNYNDQAAAGLNLTEITVSPNGAQVYLASPSEGQIYVFSGNTLAYSSSINLGFFYGGLAASTTSTTSTSSSGSSSATPSALATLNIYYWLTNNGLYDENLAPLSIANINSNNDYDKNSFHRPLAIKDINGYLYVLDNWAGEIGAPSSGISAVSTALEFPEQGIYFNMLMLRVINSTGYDVPIQPTFFNDMFSQQGCQMNSQYSSLGSDVSSNCYVNPPSDLCQQPSVSSGQFCAAYPVSTSAYLGCLGSSIYNLQYEYHYQCLNLGSMSSTYYQTSSANLYPSNTFPPYGWILSANVTGYNLQKDEIVNIDLFGKDKAALPGSYVSAENYYPIGPPMPGIQCNTGKNSGFWSSVFNNVKADFTGVACIVPTLPQVGFSVNYNNTIALLFPGGPATPSQEIFPFGYSELLISRFDVFNYTKIGGGVVYTCYSSSSIGQCKYTPQLLGTTTSSSTTSPLLSAPIYLSNNPFSYYESLGAQKVFQYANNLYSTYGSGSGSAQSAANGDYNQNCINEVSNGLEPTGCVNNGAIPTSLPLSNILNGINSVSILKTTAPSVPILQSTISGFSIIPYEYKTTMKESWTNFQFVGGYPWCPYTLPPIYYGDSSTRYGYAKTPVATSSTLLAPIEGGRSYLTYENTYNSGYYTPNLSDIGVYLSPQIYLNISSNRLFGSVYINATQAINTNKQFVLNATQQLNYIINFNNIGSNMKLDTASSVPVNINGAANAVGLNSPQTEPIPTGLGYTPSLLGPPGFGTITLFNWYQQIVYESPLKLFINGSYGNLPYGYHRLIYVLQDRFNNTIYAPIDADISRLTTINLTTNPFINASNSNQTTLNITGTAGFYVFNSLGENFYPLSNGYVYLYYDQNIDYNGINAKQQGTNGVFDAQQCAFGTSGKPGYPSQCVLANPLNASEAASGNIITYAPQFSSNGQCLPPQQSIINPQSFNCNIYSNAICPTGAQGQTQYCYPLDSAGDGLCTSQLGLMDIAKTNSNGAFSFNTVACGIGQEQIIAKYYGYPAPEPILAQQSYLPYSADPTTNQPSASFYVYNYSWMPNQTISSTQIGLFELSYGDLGLYGIAAVLIIIFITFGANHIISKRHNKSNNQIKKENSKHVKKSRKRTHRQKIAKN